MTTEIGEDQLDLLKQSSRLVHHVATPLLLSPYWRDKAMNLPRTQEEMQKVEADRMSGSASVSINEVLLPFYLEIQLIHSQINFTHHSGKKDHSK